jgi:hypothetical protein
MKTLLKRGDTLAIRQWLRADSNAEIFRTTTAACLSGFLPPASAQTGNLVLKRGQSLLSCVVFYLDVYAVSVSHGSIVSFNREAIAGALFSKPA